MNELSSIMRGKYILHSIALLAMAVIVFVFLIAWNKGATFQLESPDNKFSFELNADGELNYRLQWNNQTIITESELGFLLQDGRFIPGNLKIKNVSRRFNDEVWEPVYGEQSSYTDTYNELFVEFEHSKTFKGELAIRVRAYNEGVAFRYEFNFREELNLDSELTEFSFKGEPLVWISSSAQGPITKQGLSEVNTLCERPLLAQISDSLFVALGEASLVDFARMKLQKDSKNQNSLRAILEKENTESESSHIKHTLTIPADSYLSPWRFIMTGESPAEILQNNYLLLNLNDENKLPDTDWIKPGKVIREVTLTTKGGFACVDFAIKHNLQYIEFDAGWYGNEYDSTSDATTVTVDPKRSPGPLDLERVIAYAKKNGIGVLVYVNRRSLERQLDEVLVQLKSWGVDGIKFGFVNVGPQKWTKWLHMAVRKAAEHELMVDIHDEYRPTGYSRTFPNLMTQEGVRGDEESTPNDMVINSIFTRMIAGATDQTNCYFAERVATNMGSHASQMAKTICIYSPFQFLYWYDRPKGSPFEKGGAGGAQMVIPEIPDLSFYDAIPTVWDETKVLDGYPGKLAVIARRKGYNWYLGVLTGRHQHDLSIPLDFLTKGQQYEATSYIDDPTLRTKTNIRIERERVNDTFVYKHHLSMQNGVAVIISPI